MKLWSHISFYSFISFLNESIKETVDLYGYTDRDKVLLLVQQVSGRAALLLKSIEPGKDSLAEVLDMLTDASASKELQKFNIP